MNASPSRIRALALNAVLAGASTLLALLACEAVFRALGLGLRPVRESVPVQRFDPVLGWSKIPGITVTHRAEEYETRETLNSHGLRGPEIEAAKPEGVRRILLLGDSFTEGRAVNDDEVVSSVLARELRETLAPGSRVDVINGGTVGYGTDQQLLFFRTRGVRYEPDVTVLLFYVNDVGWNVRRRYGDDPKPRFVLDREGGMRLEPPPPPGIEPRAEGLADSRGADLSTLQRAGAWLADHSRVYFFVRSRTFGRDGPFGRVVARAGLRRVPREWMGWWKRPDAEIEHAWEVTEALLRTLHDEAAAAGSRFLVFRVPSIWNVRDDVWERTRSRYAMEEGEWDPGHDAVRLATICRRQRIDCIFPLEKFRAEARASDSDPLYYEQDVHWTPRGHELAARILAAHLGRLSFSEGS